MDRKECYIKKITKFLKEKIEDTDSTRILAEQVLKGAEGGLEINDVEFENWFENRFKYQFVWLDRDDYLKALVRALWLAPVFAGTDFGSSRQRDMAQVWTDTSRGFLGEIAVSKFFKEKFGIETALDTRRGELMEFLPTDIVKVKLPHEEWKKPDIKISIKTTKFNGRWLDVPGAQVEHSDVFILVKIGILRHHFLAFLKAVSFLKDKLFLKAKELGEINDTMAKKLWDEIPQFDSIPAYIAGYLNKNELNLPIHQLICRKKGKTKIRIAVTQGIGIFSIETLRNHPQIKELDPNGDLRIEIEPIIESITGTHFLAHSGGLKWGAENWKTLIEHL
ncbi:MAG TPA: hypothetical protein ENG63_05465 [Candidatus Desulfofervidus auxilii]|uniref:Restriction endonuclease n=1 Tax=Desulfofervidus auxilii TaxID=1621989 RepID=A0A7C0Y9I2_DESA2|nr:hypothetical protein [Candidatus Desulfofervidus auxilii]